MTTSTAIEPSNLSELQSLCKQFAESGLFGSVSPQQALVIAMAGRDLGFSYTQALRAFHLLKGKPTLSADGMVAAVLARGVCEYFRPIELTETSATWETKRVNSEPVRYTFAMVDAERARLTEDKIDRDGKRTISMYKIHPRRMLSARCKAYLARDVYPEVLMGLVTDDEAEEISRKPAPYVAPVVATIVPDDAPISAPQLPMSGLLDRIDACTSVDALNALWRTLASERANMSVTDADALKALFATRKAELTEAKP